MRISLKRLRVLLDAQGTAVFFHFVDSFEMAILHGVECRTPDGLHETPQERRSQVLLTVISGLQPHVIPEMDQVGSNSSFRHLDAST